MLVPLFVHVPRISSQKFSGSLKKCDVYTNGICGVLQMYKVLSWFAQEGPNPSPDWITPRCWKEIQALENLSKFNEFVESFKQAMSQFKAVFDAQEAHL